MRESPIVTSALKIMRMVGIECWRVNAGMLLFDDTGKKRVMKGAPKGTPDIMVIVPRTLGRLGGIEMKRPKTHEHAAGTLRPSQEEWRDRAVRLGVLYEVAHSANEALAIVRQWERQYAE